jgi:hypothetical protein
MEHTLTAFDVLTGQILWSVPSQKKGNDKPDIVIDPTSRMATIELSHEPYLFAQVELRTGKLLGTSTTGAPPGPKDTYWLRESGVEGLRFGDAKEPILGPEHDPERFLNPDGSQFMQSRPGGAVRLYDLREVRRRLTTVGLEW